MSSKWNLSLVFFNIQSNNQPKEIISSNWKLSVGFFSPFNQAIKPEKLCLVTEIYQLGFFHHPTKQSSYGNNVY